eukprot:NODE_770_length_1204_cov_118.131848_g730_i0.p1 GENE.NODE_770_length_1204_cov_118.131848_g730_i0~~NODE_770_length_1204_cov_118.131848_g730_i0.p1  ORF type:complete len:332 (-),score=76.15 NODE_770_length_1204_cov_118.131848_g730_i0:125-1120(-)
MAEIYAWDVVAIKSTGDRDGEVRLDLGEGSLKMRQRADHESWATQLTIVSCEGIGEGEPVCEGQIFKLIGGDNCLDLGAASNEASGDHDSWATRVHIVRTNGPDNECLRYGDTCKVISEISGEGHPARLDIGEACFERMSEAGHDSWATNVRAEKLGHSWSYGSGSRGYDSGSLNGGDTIAIYSTGERDGQVRLDLGEGAMKQRQTADHDSWATRLRIASPHDRVPDGTPLWEGAAFKLVTYEEQELCLDLGALTSETPADHESWATRLHIQKLDDEGGPLCFGDCVRVISEPDDGGDGHACRLDLGEACIDNSPDAGHNSWATVLKALRV